jgi:hypothetical protein
MCISVAHERFTGDESNPGITNRNRTINPSHFAFVGVHPHHESACRHPHRLSPSASRLDWLFGSRYGRSPSETARFPFLGVS